jgi:hypothetical protein
MVLDLQVLVEEIRRVGTIRPNPADFGGSHKDVLGAVPGIELIDGDRIQEVQLKARATQQALEALSFEFPPDRAAHHALVARHVNESILSDRHRRML